MQSVGTSKSGREVFEQLMALNVLNEGNHDLKRTVGIDLKGIYMVGLRRMNCWAQVHYLLHLQSFTKYF